jgi:hypothetical protein
VSLDKKPAWTKVKVGPNSPNASVMKPANKQSGTMWISMMCRKCTIGTCTIHTSQKNRLGWKTLTLAEFVMAKKWLQYGLDADTKQKKSKKMSCPYWVHQKCISLCNKTEDQMAKVNFYGPEYLKH